MDDMEKDRLIDELREEVDFWRTEVRMLNEDIRYLKYELQEADTRY